MNPRGYDYGPVHRYEVPVVEPVPVGARRDHAHAVAAAAELVGQVYDVLTDAAVGGVIVGR